MAKKIFLLVIIVFFITPFTYAFIEKMPTVNLEKKEETHLLLAHKWKNGNNILDLKINGRFEAQINGESFIYGYWEISSNQETLVLSNDPTDEDVFELEYTLSDVSFLSIKLIDKEGRELSFSVVGNKD